MIDFAIRDDDINFWTKPQDLNNLYRELWQQQIPISFSIIPFCVATYHWGDPERFYQNPDDIGDIANNKNLISFLKKLIDQRQIDLMLHGYCHLYRIRRKESKDELLATGENLHSIRKTVRGSELIWLGEYRWKSQGDLVEQTIRGRNHLERILKTPIKVFVPPSNDLGKQAVKAIEGAKLNLSGGSNPINLKYWSFILREGNPYPYPIKVGKHWELTFYTLSPKVDFRQLKSQFDRCIKFKAPFVLATHHWELLKHPKMRTTFNQIIEYVQRVGANFRTISKIIEQYD